MSKPKVALKERRNVEGKRYLVFDAETTPGIIVDWEDWGFRPDVANFLAWCLKHRKMIEEQLKQSE